MPATDPDPDWLGEVLSVKLDDNVTVSATVGYQEDATPDTMLVLFPPHPALGGDAENNVITALFHAGIRKGWLTTRFNYRGVDNNRVGTTDLLTYWDQLDSSGDYTIVEADAAQVIEQVRHGFGGGRRLLFAAYSFGCWVALRLAPRLRPAGIAAISPPVNDHPFAPLFAAHAQTIVLTAEEDAFCPPEDLHAALAGSGIPALHLPAEDHFFRGCETELATEAVNRLAHMGNQQRSPA